MIQRSQYKCCAGLMCFYLLSWWCDIPAGGPSPCRREPWRVHRRRRSSWRDYSPPSGTSLPCTQRPRIHETFKYRCILGPASTTAVTTNNFSKAFTRRMHSSGCVPTACWPYPRMHCRGGVSRQRPSGQKPPGQNPPLGRHPPGRHPPWTESQTPVKT